MKKKKIANGKGVVLAGNSIGSRIALETTLLAPESVRGLLLFNAAAGINNKFTLTDTLTPLSLKLFAIPIFSLLDILLKNVKFSSWLFERTRKPENILSTLRSVYVNKAACDDELVGSIASAAQDANALEVIDQISQIKS
jgi:pimeloyl-ACP methyl ester carboxylesterase